MLNRLVPCEIPVMLYHVVSDQQLPHIKHIYGNRNVNYFKRDMDYISRHFDIITIDALLNYYNKGISLPQRPILLTFDDGFKEMHDIVMPILLHKSIPAAFFIAVDAVDNRSLLYRNKSSVLADYLGKQKEGNSVWKTVEDILQKEKLFEKNTISSVLSIKFSNRLVLDEIAERIDFSFSNYLDQNKPYLTQDQIREIKQKGFGIGSHSMSHPNFNQLTEEERFLQIRDSFGFLQANELLTHRVFAFPFNSNSLSNSFLKNLYEKEQVELTLGTRGMVNDSRFRHLNRFHMDFSEGNTEFHLAKYMAKGYVKSVIKRIRPV